MGSFVDDLLVLYVTWGPLPLSRGSTLEGPQYHDVPAKYEHPQKRLTCCPHVTK